MLTDFLNPENFVGSYKKLCLDNRDRKNIAVFSMPLINRIYLTSILLGKSIFVVNDFVEEEKIYSYFKGFLGNKVVRLFDKDDMLLYKNSISLDSIFKRTSAIFKILTSNVKVVVLSLNALCQAVPSKAEFLSKVLDFKVGEEIELGGVIKKLVEMGYKREDFALQKGTFSVRGDILDIYSVSEDKPVRIELFGDEIEKIKFFDEETRRSIKEIESVKICPSGDIFLSEDEKKEALFKMNKQVFEEKNAERKDRMLEILEDINMNISSYNPSINNYLLGFTNKWNNSILSYFDNETTIVYNEPKALKDKMEVLVKDNEFRFKSLFNSGEVFSEHKNQVISFELIESEMESFKKISFQNILSSTRLFKEDAVYSFKEKELPSYQRNAEELITDLVNWQRNKYTVFFALKDTSELERLEEFLNEHDLVLNILKDKNDRVTSFNAIFCDIEKGFLLHDEKVVVIGYENIFKRQKKVLPRKKKSDVFFEIQIGDYAVHTKHGIGIFRGIKQIKISSVIKDFAVVEYKGGDLLYVPLDQMGELNKFQGGENVKLSKIGGIEFEKVKARAKASIKEMAIDLFALYKERKEQKGFCYSKDNELMREFEDSFEYEETPDQLRSIKEIKTDMENGKVMDRLLCGDVGFGKTEVAMRSSFKTVLDGKQVAFLCPTTILAEQHYNTFKARFKDFGVRIEVVNRFKTDKELKVILEQLKTHKLDIVCGTHRLLSSDVVFSDLGLLVIDEEQRFGVEHKEKIKVLKNNVNVLSMSATPIPRTLHMSLSGIRDISTIETPPLKRLPVQSYVLEETDSVIVDAIRKEVSRNGQVFLLYNRIESIDSFSFKVQELTGVRVATIHSKLPEKVLEDIVVKFYNHEYDVLVCTTIIENGIDLKNANTLIVIDADKLGLSQLYQLRGRVGRSDKLAYAYFMYKPYKSLSENSYKRLEAITEYTEFGSGFKIAMKDLEIRGFGNVLGKDQHGYMEKIGYDMYVKLLEDSVSELSGNVKTNVETEIEVNISAFIPNNYIENESERVRCYQDMSRIVNDEEMKEYIVGLTDIYGSVPDSINNVMLIAIAKNIASSLGITKVVINEKESFIELNDIKVLQNIELLSVLDGFKEKFFISGDKKPRIEFELKKYSVKQKLLIMKEILFKTLKRSKK